MKAAVVDILGQLQVYNFTFLSVKYNIEIIVIDVLIAVVRPVATIYFYFSIYRNYNIKTIATSVFNQLYISGFAFCS